YTNFAVERSTNDGKTFDVISSVASSGLGTYSVTDKTPVLNAADKYRLKLEDLNGTISYSPVVTLMYGELVDAGNPVSIYPNPAKNDLNLSIMQISNSSAAP